MTYVYVRISTYIHLYDAFMMRQRSLTLSACSSSALFGLSGWFNFECELVVCVLSLPAATVGSIITIFSCWDVCLFSRSGRPPALPGGICIVCYCVFCSFIVFTYSLLLIAW